MLTSQVFKSRTGLHYTLRLTNKGFSSLPNAIKAESFTDKNAALQFVTNLQVPLFFWENLAQSNTFFSYRNWTNANPWAGIENYIAQALTQGSVQAYKTASISQLNESRQLRSFKDTQGKRFELQPAASLLVNATAGVKPVHNKVSAEKVLQDLNITAETAESINKSFNLPANSGTSVEALKTALINGDIVLTQVPEPLKPESTGDFVEAVFEAAKSPSAPPPQAAPPAAKSTHTEAKESPTEKAPVRDDKTTADVLNKAAKEGTPFCEECQQTDDNKAA